MDANKIEPKDIILASQKLEKRCEKLASNATKILVFKGKKITEFSGSKNSIEKMFSSCWALLVI